MVGQTIEPKVGVLGKSIRGGKWLAFGYALQKLIGLGSFVVLARLLAPAEFGVMAIIFIVPKFLESTTDTGFSTAVIQRTDDVRQYLNPIWTIRILKAILLCALIFAFGPLIATFFHAPDALWAIRLAGIFPILLSLSNIGETYFFKDLDFKKIFWRNTSREIAFVAAALLSIIFIKSYWALFIANLAAYSIQVASTYWLSDYRPSFSFQFRSLKGLINYSKWIVSQRWLFQMYNLLEKTVVARLTNVSSVGLFSKARSLAAVVPGFLSDNLNMITFPAFSQIKTEAEKVKTGFIKSLDLLFFLLVPTSVLILTAGDRLIEIILGGSWLAMTNTLRILVLFALVGAINQLALSLFNAVGEPKKQSVFSLVKIIITALLIIPLTISWGIEGAAGALLAGSIAVLLLNINSLTKLAIVTYANIFTTLIVPLAASLVLLWPVVIWKSASPIIFISIVSLGGLLYLGIIYWVGEKFNQGPYQTVKLILESFFKK